MKNQIEKFLAKFPDNATCWSQATDEIRDLARTAKEIYNELELSLTDVEVEVGKGLQPLNFRSFSKPSQWNTLGKQYILDTFDKMGDRAKRIFFNRFSEMVCVMNIYTENGYKDRNEYLTALSEEYEVDIETVQCLADLLGEAEDFDGLVSALEDI